MAASALKRGSEVDLKPRYSITTTGVRSHLSPNLRCGMTKMMMMQLASVYSLTLCMHQQYGMDLIYNIILTLSLDQSYKQSFSLPNYPADIVVDCIPLQCYPCPFAAEVNWLLQHGQEEG